MLKYYVLPSQSKSKILFELCVTKNLNVNWEKIYKLHFGQEKCI